MRMANIRSREVCDFYALRPGIIRWVQLRPVTAMRVREMNVKFYSGNLKGSLRRRRRSVRSAVS
jgi:hypothetical protein